jgi:hypothetical protein
MSKQAKKVYLENIEKWCKRLKRVVPSKIGSKIMII